MEKLLLLHEALGSSEQYSPLIKSLGNDFEVYAPDFPGHGGSEITDEEYSMRYFADYVYDYLNSKKIDSINIFGYSLGGYIALLLAWLHPEKVKKIFTFAVSFDWNEINAEQKVSKLEVNKLIEKAPHYAMELERRHAPADWKKLVKKTQTYMRRLGKDKELNNEYISSIDHPVQLGIGDKDNLSSVEETVRVYRLLKNGQLSVFPDTYHPIEKIDINRLAFEIKNFFKLN